MWGRVLIGLLAVVVGADEYSHHYKPSELVKVWADRTGPWKSPREYYGFEELPTCELWQTSPERKSVTIGGALEGKRPVLSPRLLIHFPDNTTTAESGTVLHTPESSPQDVCRMRLTTEVVSMLNELISAGYYYAYEIDGLPVYAFLGEMEDDKPRFFAHRRFIFEKNGDQIVSVSIVPSEPVVLQANRELRYTYDTLWMETAAPFNKRHHRYYETTFFERKVQWFSLITSTLLTMLLLGVVVLILNRTLKSDFAALEDDIDESEVLGRLDDAGWKIISKDVFRKPYRLRAHATVCGTGAQLACVALLASVLALFRAKWGAQPMTISAILWLYALCQPVNGFAGSILYTASGGRGWKSTAAWQLLFFPAVVAALFLQLNTGLIAHGNSTSLSLGQLIRVILIFAIFHTPLHYLGVHLGRTKAYLLKSPVKPNTLERPVPPKPSWVKPLNALAAGALPFGCLLVEIYFVMDAVWTNRLFFIYGFVLAVVLLYAASIICATITATYLLLSMEDHKWQWFAFNCGAAPAFYMILFACYYKSSMLIDSFFQTFTFWIVTGLGVVSLGLASGAIGYMAALLFVRRIYSNVKSD